MECRHLIPQSRIL